MCLFTGYVPDGFGRSKITPIVNDKFGDDISKVTNNQTITIVCIFSKNFESCIFKYVEQFIPRNYLQFCYVKGGGCEKACLCLHSIIDYFTLRGSNVFFFWFF